MDALDPESNKLSADKEFSIKLSDIEDVLADLCRFVIAATEEIGADEMANVIRSAATCCVALNTILSGIDAERDSRNDAADFMPPVLPHQIGQLRSQDFADIIRKQKDHLSDRRSQQSIVLIRQEF